MKYTVKYILNWFPGLSWCLTPCSLEEKQRFCKGPGGIISQPATWHRNKMLSSRSTMSPGDDFPCLVFVKSAHVQFSSVAQLCPTLCDPMNHSTPSLPVHHQLPESTQPMSIESVMPSNHLILCCPLLLLPSIFPSIRVFSSETALHIRWPKHWSFSFSISPSNEYAGVDFLWDWLVWSPYRETLKSLLQHHSLKASILR